MERKDIELIKDQLMEKKTSKKKICDKYKISYYRLNRLLGDDFKELCEKRENKRCKDRTRKARRELLLEDKNKLENRFTDAQVAGMKNELEQKLTTKTILGKKHKLSYYELNKVLGSRGAYVKTNGKRGRKKGWSRVAGERPSNAMVSSVVLSGDSSSSDIEMDEMPPLPIEENRIEVPFTDPLGVSSVKSM